MREVFNDILAAQETDDLLTTTEAATLLGVSRQHIVDLCDRGDLPYLTVGSHRRIRRSDLLRAQERTTRLTRDQRRSLWLGCAVAGKIVMDPKAAVNNAKANLGDEAPGRNKWREEWIQLLDGPIDGVLEALTSPSPKSRELRQNSPFSILTESERARVLASFRENAVSK